MDLSTHPCFNEKARRSHGRVHLPVAPRCNIQCKFCNRKFNCVNESRPGVTSGVLSPIQALRYLEAVQEQCGNISVVGIAGPGDPFANPEETLETLRLVREQYPDMLLCVASNGLNVRPFVEELVSLKVSHVTITVNAITPAIGMNIYAWVRYGRRVHRAEQGAEILLEHQLAAIQRLKERGMTVKVNSIILPGLNDAHIPFVAEKMAAMGVDIFNCIPYYRNEGSAFANLSEPSRELVDEVKQAAARYLPQMQHCARCRADAAGLIGKNTSGEFMRLLKEYEQAGIPKPAALTGASKPYVAVASMEGMLVNQHLGEATRLLIYGKPNGHVVLIETRATPAAGSGMQRWEQLSDTLNDCRALLVSGIGQNPKILLHERGINVIVIEGVIEQAVDALFKGRDINYLLKRKPTACGAECSGGGEGCG